MAQRRMISTAISTSETVNSMSVFAQLLFTWAIVHHDDFGIIPGSPAKLQAIVKPLDQRPTAEIAAAVAEWLEAGSHVAYTGDDGRVYLRAVNFDVYQTGLHKRTRSRYPDAGEQLDSTRYLETVSGNFSEFPPQQNRTEQNGTEGNGTEENGNGTEKNRNGSQRRAPIGDTPEYRLASLFLELIRERDPKATANLQTWAKQIRTLINKGRTPEEIEGVLRYAQGDDRECRFTLSPKALDRNFTKLIVDMQRHKPTPRLSLITTDPEEDYDARARANG